MGSYAGNKLEEPAAIGGPGSGVGMGREGAMNGDLEAGHGNGVALDPGVGASPSAPIARTAVGRDISVGNGAPVEDSRAV